MCLKVFIFVKIIKNFKNPRIFLMKSANKIRFPINFQKPRNFFTKSANFFVCFCFKMYTKRTCSQFKKNMGAKRPKSLVYIESIRDNCMRIYRYNYSSVRSSTCQNVVYHRTFQIYGEVEKIVLIFWKKNFNCLISLLIL